MAPIACSVDGARGSRCSLSRNRRRRSDAPFSESCHTQASTRLSGYVPRGTAMTRVVALANQKGGVGKTTTAINLGASLAACERKVLLIDLDPQANATSGIGLSKTDAESMYGVILDGVPLRSIIRPTELATLFVAPSSVDLVGAEVELGTAENREFRLRTAIKDVGAEYDYILIDSPPSLGLLTVNALTAADSVLVPMQCEYFAMEGV